MISRIRFPTLFIMIFLFVTSCVPSQVPGTSEQKFFPGLPQNTDPPKIFSDGNPTPTNTITPILTPTSLSTSTPSPLPPLSIITKDNIHNIVELTRLEILDWGSQSLSWSPDGTKLAIAIADGSIWIWDVTRQNVSQILKGHDDLTLSVAWSPNGNYLATGSSDNTIIIWGIETGEPAYFLEGHTHGVTAVSWSPDGLLIASGSHDMTLRIWDGVTGEQVAVIESPSWIDGIAWSFDGSFLATANKDGNIRVYRRPYWPVTKVLLGHRGGHNGGVTSVAWSPENFNIVSTGRDFTVRLWNAMSTRQIYSFDIPQPFLFQFAVAWSPDGSILASGGEFIRISLWDTISGDELYSFRTETNVLFSIAWSPDGKMIATTGSRRESQDAGLVQLWGILEE